MSNGNLGHAQLAITHSDDSYSDIMEMNKARQDSFTYMDVRVGVSNDTMTAELYIDNLSMTKELKLVIPLYLIDNECLT